MHPCTHAPQASFLGFCDSLDAADCGLEACTRPPHTLVYELRCFLRAFADSYGGAANLPQGAAFTTALRNWLPSEYESDVGFVDGKVKYARIEFKMTMSKLQPSFKVGPCLVSITARSTQGTQSKVLTTQSKVLRYNLRLRSTQAHRLVFCLCVRPMCTCTQDPLLDVCPLYTPPR